MVNRIGKKHGKDFAGLEHGQEAIVLYKKKGKYFRRHIRVIVKGHQLIIPLQRKGKVERL